MSKKLLTAILVLTFALLPRVSPAADVSPADRGVISGDVFEKGRGRVHPFISVSGMWTDNLFNTDHNTESDYAGIVAPGVWLAVPGSRERVVEILTSNATPGGLLLGRFHPEMTRRYQAYLLYTPQFEFYAHNPDENFVHHTADAYFRFDTQNRFSVDVIDQFRRSRDRTSARIFNIEDRYYTNLFNTILAYDLARLRFRVDYSNFYVDYAESENDGADRMDNSASAYVYYHFMPKTSAFVEYEFSNIHYDDNVLDSDEHRFFAGVRWEFAAKSQGQLKAGYGIKEFEESFIDDADNWMLELQVDHTFTPKTKLTVGAYRRYDETYLGGTDYILTHGLVSSFAYAFSPKINANLYATFVHDDYEGDLFDRGRLRERRDWELSASPSVRWEIFRWLWTDLSYIFTKHESNFTDQDYINNTVLLRVTASM